MIGIFGGTFDPVHYGHLRPALELLEDLSLQQLRWIPCRQPPHRDAPAATAEQRLRMLELAVDGVKEFVVDTRELQRPGPSYMIDTLESLRAEGIAQPLCLILGLDAYLGLDRWHRWQSLLEHAHIVVCARPQSEPELPPALQALEGRYRVAQVQALRQQAAGRIYYAAVTQLDISATRIRAACAAGHSLRYLLPETVREYILEQRLYAA